MRVERRALSLLARVAGAVLVLAMAVTTPEIGRAEDERSPTVGFPARIGGLVLPGSELEPKPLAERAGKVVVRLLGVWPHGSALRYDLEYQGLEAGKYDLRDYLRRKDGSSAADLPSIPVEIRSLLPPGQVRPNALELQPGPRLGGYRVMLTVAGILWVLGLAAILLVGWRRRAAEEARARPRTLADHLRPLVEGAMAGRLTTSQLAELERSLLIYWQRRLHMGERKPAEALVQLRGHDQAGPLLQQLETWLHRPGPSPNVDVAALLRPYRDIPAEAENLEAQPS